MAPTVTASRRLIGHLAIIVILGAAAVGMYAHVWVSGSPAHTTLCQCGDPGQSVWFLAWVPWAITHGHNPLFTTRMLAGQGGANLLQSTSYLFPSFILAPVTWLFGPTVSFNVAQTAAPVLSGWGMYVAAGRVSERWVPRAAAALLWGFSPFLVGSEIFGHLNYDWLFFPPLLFAVLYEIVARESLRAWVAGALLGALLVVQFFTGTEPLLLVAVAAVPGLVAAAAAAPRVAWARRRRIATAFGVAAAITAVLLAYPLWFLTSGPRHTIGPPWPAINVVGSPIDSIYSAGAPKASSTFFRVGGYFGAQGPPQSFLGLALLVVIAAGCALVALRRQRVAVAVIVSGGFAWLCGLGAFLLPLSRTSDQWWLPWRYLHHWPFLLSAGPQRFAMVVIACAALLLAMTLDGVSWALERLAGGPGRRERPAITAGVIVAQLAVFVVAVVPIATTYTFPLAMNAGVTPTWFLTAAHHLPPDARILTYPYASSSSPDAMYWQAEDDLGFELVGGRALIPGADGRHSQHVSPLRGTDGVLMNSSAGTGPPTPPAPVEVDALRASLRRWGVDVVVVVARARAPEWAVGLFMSAIGRPPSFEDGAAVWRLSGVGVGVGGSPPGRPVYFSAARFAACDGAPVVRGALERAAACFSQVRR